MVWLLFSYPACFLVVSNRFVKIISLSLSSSLIDSVLQSHTLLLLHRVLIVSCLKVVLIFILDN